MSPSNGPMTVEQGRALAARARVYQSIGKVALVASGIAIPLFALSYLELRRLDDIVAAGGRMGIPYFAYATILLFLAGTATVIVTRLLVVRISLTLAAEQTRRWTEGDAPTGPMGGAVRSEVGHVLEDDTPAAAG